MCGRYSLTVNNAHSRAKLQRRLRHFISGRREDAPYIVQEFHELYGKIDILQLPNYRTYVKLMIDGTPSKPFSAVRLARSSAGYAWA